MKKAVFLLFVMFLVGTGLGADEAADLLRTSERAIFPSVYYSRIRMTTEKPGSPDRTVEMESWYEEGKGTFMEMTAPVRSKGIRMLQTPDSLWLFNPRSGGKDAVRLSPDSSFQGSLFSNDDVGDSQFSDDYLPALRGLETIEVEGMGDVRCRILVAEAKHRKATYGTLKFWIAEGDIPVRIEYYARSGILMKVMNLYGVRQMAGRRRPTLLSMESREQQGFRTEVEILEMTAYDDIPDAKFSRANLVR